MWRHPNLRVAYVAQVSPQAAGEGRGRGPSHELGAAWLQESLRLCAPLPVALPATRPAARASHPHCPRPLLLLIPPPRAPPLRPDTMFAQHAFHHVELHLNSSPAEYIWWRYGAGEDREAAAKVTRKVRRARRARSCPRELALEMKRGLLPASCLPARRSALRHESRRRHGRPRPEQQATPACADRRLGWATPSLPDPASFFLSQMPPGPCPLACRPLWLAHHSPHAFPALRCAVLCCAQMTEAEVAEREAAIAAGRRVVDYLNSRRKAGKGFEYEVRRCKRSLGMGVVSCYPRAAAGGTSPNAPLLGSAAWEICSVGPVQCSWLLLTWRRPGVAGAVVGVGSGVARVTLEGPVWHDALCGSGSSEARRG